MRNVYIFLGLFALVIVPYLIWGEWFDEFFDAEIVVDRLKSYGDWAWLAGLGLLIGDLFLPLPGTIIMSALGYLYGPFIGGLLAVSGNALSGILAFVICRSLGQKGAIFLLGQKDFEKGRQLFEVKGGWIVALSRWLPVFPEVISCMAGINRMGWKSYTLALLSGSLPLGFVYAYVGYIGLKNPYLAIVMSAVLPMIIWLIAHSFLRRQMKA